MDELGIFKDFTDESIKSIYSINGNIIEMTLLQNREDTDVVCVPTHHFCNLGCKMCHLTNNKLNKRMIPIKYENFENALEKTVKNINNERRTNKKILLISFMGVGEPLLNLDLLKDVFLNRNNIAKNLDYEHVGFALSTIMPNSNVNKLTKFVNENNIPLKIYFLLHTPFDIKRKLLLPSANIDVEQALHKLNVYESVISKNKTIMKKFSLYHKTNKLTEMYYTLIENENDSDEELDQLIYLLRKYKISIKFIRFNYINNSKQSTKENKWISRIKNETNVNVKSCMQPKSEVNSFCCEFIKHYYLEEIETKKEYDEFIRWKNKHQIYE